VSDLLVLSPGGVGAALARAQPPIIFAYDEDKLDEEADDAHDDKA
jgi:hypothetical protein